MSFLGISPEQALERLVEGNRRFQQAGVASRAREWSRDLATGVQRPFAIVLGCSDSRTPVEILFDVGFGDLFVVRIAGNIVSPSVVGSIEFAASAFGTRLVVVMGHTRCGAIGATVRTLQTGLGPQSKNIQAITDRIAPHIEGVVQAAKSNIKRKRATVAIEELVHSAMRAHVRASVDHLRHGSAIIEEMVRSGVVAVIGAEYELETGAVRFLDALPATKPRSKDEKTKPRARKKDALAAATRPGSSGSGSPSPSIRGPKRTGRQTRPGAPPGSIS